MRLPSPLQRKTRAKYGSNKATLQMPVLFHIHGIGVFKMEGKVSSASTRTSATDPLVQISMAKAEFEKFCETAALVMDHLYPEVISSDEETPVSGARDED